MATPLGDNMGAALDINTGSAAAIKKYRILMFLFRNCQPSAVLRKILWYLATSAVGLYIILVLVAWLVKPLLTLIPMRSFLPFFCGFKTNVWVRDESNRLLHGWCVAPCAAKKLNSTLHGRNLTRVLLAPLPCLVARNQQLNDTDSPAENGVNQCFEDKDLPADGETNGATPHDTNLTWTWTDPTQIHVLLSHGNGANLSFYQVLIGLFSALGYVVWVYDYPGFGKSAGTESEQGCYDAGFAFYKELVHKRGIPPERLVLVGMSLGGAVTAKLAATCPHRALILIASFVSPRHLLSTIFRPLCLIGFICNDFDVEKDLLAFRQRAPLQAATRSLILHSKQDRLIHYSHAERNARTLGCKVIPLTGWHGDPTFTQESVAAIQSLINKEV
jgi:predicted esterase